MRFFLWAAFSFLHSFSTAYSQSLSADAGPDKAWCDSWHIPNTDTPVLGASPAASGGVGPYSYEWSVSSIATNYLDNKNAEHPKLINKPYNQNSIRFVLKVTDAAGTTAYDTAWVYFQKVICTLGMTVIAKRPTDTVNIDVSLGGCDSQFPPLSEYRWRPVDYLIDSTTYPARCFSPVSKRYSLYMKDRIGCPLRSIMEVVINPVGVENVKDVEGPRIAFDGVQKTVQVQFSEKGKFTLLDMAGRAVWEQPVSGNTRLDLPQNLPASLYVGVLYNEKGHLVVREKIQL